MSKRRLCQNGLILTVFLTSLLGFLAVWRPPVWRAELYEGMFDACRDQSLIRARIWLFLGASPDGASDYEAGRPGLEFSSHVHVAISDKDTRVLRLLLAKGASPNLELGDGTTPLCMAIHDHNIEATKILLEAGANPRYSDKWTAVDQAKSLNFLDLIPIIEPYLDKM